MLKNVDYQWPSFFEEIESRGSFEDRQYIEVLEKNCDKELIESIKIFLGTKNNLSFNMVFLFICDIYF